jgi:hypothetical protein
MGPSVVDDRGGVVKIDPRLVDPGGPGLSIAGE